ncbi:SH3 domain-containing protein [Helicobacter sp. MIT 21-1697]|uniref:SH3 domain-containing protein n=1 Tax=Helicobacter sp. MIT 21-1697 TaxID=2993733 RepID=UPI00224B13FC|nr:SH3 domain-containing protein [Helicobacter sp. MIT 21-1697]MCX2717146.1 SH3 domain-containing protein [Helicobacter sp. MIT 21-1697]
MNARTFFKLYSLPFLIILFGLGVYGGILVFVAQKNFITMKHNVSSTPTQEGVPNTESPQIADLTPNAPSNQEAPKQSIAQNTHNPLVQDIHEPENTSIENIPATQSPINIQTASSEPPQASVMLPADSHAQTHRYAKYRSNIRKAPSSESIVVSYADAGEVLDILDTQNGWSKVKNTRGIEGYIASRLLSESVGQSEGEAYIVLADVLKVRAAPDLHAAVIGHLNHNSHAFVLEIQEEWAKILFNRQYGYISSHYIVKEGVN